MRKYIVITREVWTQPYMVEAASEEEAKSLVSAGNAQRMDEGLEYSHEMGAEHYSVEDAENDIEQALNI